MVSFYNILTIVAIDFFILFDKGSPELTHKIEYGKNIPIGSLLRKANSTALNTGVSKTRSDFKQTDVGKRAWANINSKDMKYTDPAKNILGWDFDRFDVRYSLRDFIYNDQFFHNLLINMYQHLGVTVTQIDKESNPLVNDKFLQTLIINMAYFIFISHMEYGNSTSTYVQNDRSLINVPQWWAVLKLGGLSERSFRDSLNMQLRSSSAITNSMNRKLNYINGRSKKKSSNSFLNNGPGALFPSNITLVYMIDLNNNNYKTTASFFSYIKRVLSHGLLESADISNTNIFSKNRLTKGERNLYNRVRLYMYYLTEGFEQFEHCVMSGGAWLENNKAAYLATWRFSNTKMSRLILSEIGMAKYKYDK